MGYSFGAGISVLLAKKRPAGISSLTLLCPVLDYRKTFLEPETEKAKKRFPPDALSEARRKGQFDLGHFQMGYELFREFHRYKPGEALLKLDIPTLIIHGTKDSIVPYDVARHYGKKYRNGRFLSVKNADHGLKGFKRTLSAEIVKWILKNL